MKRYFTLLPLIGICLIITYTSFSQTFSNLIKDNHRPIKIASSRVPKILNASILKKAAVLAPSTAAFAAANAAVNTAKKLALDANTDFTLPDLGGSNLNVVPTPSFFINQSFNEKFGGGITFYCNSFGTDSSMQKVSSKLLNPQLSTVSLKIDGAHFIPWLTLYDGKKTVKGKIVDDQASGVLATAGLVWELNFAWKKVSFFDTSAKTNTNFNPFVIHPKVGIVCAFLNSYFTVAGYYNYLCVETENTNFSSFFKTGGKTVFSYPEIDITGLIDINSSAKQTVKIGIQLLINNKNTKYFFTNNDHVMPYLKIGFVSVL